MLYVRHRILKDEFMKYISKKVTIKISIHPGQVVGTRVVASKCCCTRVMNLFVANRAV